MTKCGIGPLALWMLAACDHAGSSAANIPTRDDLAPGGVYVAYNHGCRQGCNEISKGDLIQRMDGAPVSKAADLDTLIDGKPHTLELLHGGSPRTVVIEANPITTLPPLEQVPPFWTVEAQALNAAPDWARRRMFGHASPSLMLVNVDGEVIDGRQLYGKKRFIIYWDWGDRVEEAAAVDFMQVLQKAQGDLQTQGIDVMFVHVQFPGGRKAPMNDSDLRAWQATWSVREGDQPFPPLPMFRYPNATEFNAAREVGMENAFTTLENLGKSPAIVLLDERGIVRWHSEGVEDPTSIGSAISDPEQATIIAAVEFALQSL